MSDHISKYMGGHFGRIAASCLASTLSTTREYWRNKMLDAGMTDEEIERLVRRAKQLEAAGDEDPFRNAWRIFL